MMLALLRCYTSIFDGFIFTWNPQRQIRSRRCNPAQNGGSTSICTLGSQEQYQKCSSQDCRKFHHVLTTLTTFLKVKVKSKVNFIKISFSSSSSTLLLGLLGTLGKLQQNMWGRGESHSHWECSTFFLSWNSQTRSRYRSCNLAQNGGSTSICTSYGSQTQPCINPNCRKFNNTFHVYIKDRPSTPWHVGRSDSDPWK